MKTNDNLWLHLPQLSTTPYLVVRQTLLNVEPSTCLGSPLPPMAFASIESMSATDMMIAATIRTKTTTTAVGQVVVDPCYVHVMSTLKSRMGSLKLTMLTTQWP